MQFCIIILFLLVFHFCQPQQQGFKIPFEPTKWTLVFDIKEKSKSGYLVLVEPRLKLNNYHSEENFNLYLREILSQLKKEEFWIPERTILIFPVGWGNPLLFAGESESIFLAESEDIAFQKFFENRKLEFWTKRVLLCQSIFCKPDSIVYKSKSREAASIFQNTLSTLSKEFRIGILAGSIRLPGPKVLENKISTSEEDLEDFFVYFDPNGDLTSLKKEETVLTKLGYLSISNKPNICYVLMQTPSEDPVSFQISIGFPQNFYPGMNNSKTDLVFQNRSVLPKKKVPKGDNLYIIPLPIGISEKR